MDTFKFFNLVKPCSQEKSSIKSTFTHKDIIIKEVAYGKNVDGYISGLKKPNETT